jgi:hypothetical protein
MAVRNRTQAASHSCPASRETMTPTSSENILPALTYGAWAGFRGDQFLAACLCAENNDDFARGGYQYVRTITPGSESKTITGSARATRGEYRLPLTPGPDEMSAACAAPALTAPINIAPAIQPRMHRAPVAPRFRPYFIRTSGNEPLNRGVILIWPLEFPHRIDFLFSAEKTALNRVNSRDSSPLDFASKVIAAVAQEFSPAV